jgi:peptidyl-prolyl cis-trans isomerase B (cyclophilin B)
VAGKDRKKQLARQRYERQQLRKAQQRKRAQRIRIIGSVVSVAVIAGAVGGITMLVAGDQDPAASSSPTPADPNQPGDGKPKQELAINSVAVSGGSGGNASCKYMDSKEDKGAPDDLGKPPATAAFTGRPTATIKTSLGDVKVELDASKAPCTVNSFAHLAKEKFLEKSKCHRLTTPGDQPGGLAVLQCGDPSGTGAGGPGYRYANENTKGAKYKRGVLAMAHSQQKDSNGSQFFIVYADSELPADYTIFGKITSGMEVVDKVAKAGVAAQ